MINLDFSCFQCFSIPIDFFYFLKFLLIFFYKGLVHIPVNQNQTLLPLLIFYFNMILLTSNVVPPKYHELV